jgi:acyl-CoA thioesterase-1
MRWMLLSLLLALFVAHPAAAEQMRLTIFGDSLTAGYGLPQEHAFPVKLEAALKKMGANVKVLNAGVSGDTTAGGRARLDWTLADEPTHVIVELGANDALRGIDPAMTRENLDAIVTRLREDGIRVMLAGMYAPPNWGKDYENVFRSIYPDLARKHRVALYPFFLDGVATEPELNQPDGIHPNEAGVAVLVDRMGPVVFRWLDRKE